ncbi:S-layer homology domain-containing protein [Trichomonas vaginalis G3]|uniref:S-layer homology domain-containing protein n=1 Tax=Trichomonas vaginalis (strain ATCC PRA-98 / G3) TaxID=412133 RepID=UPI0021E606A1|nr:S-layer homology domain-containing protein [Trichomonas vaginalis G3]KAI5499028.1 S-layer homology domain-containing protein [Trichomonas vaginalis G3]
MYANYHVLMVEIMDEHGSSVFDYKYIQIVNQPKIKSVKFDKNVYLLNELATVTIDYSDVDKGKYLMFYYVVDEKTYTMWSGAKSNGNDQTSYQITFIPFDLKPALKSFQFYVTSRNILREEKYKNSDSPVKSIPLTITFSPTLTLYELSETVYSSEERIKFSGTLKCDLLAYIEFWDGATSVGRIGPFESGTIANTIWELPQTMKYGSYNLVARAIDKNNYESEEGVDIFIQIRNKPTITSVTNYNTVIPEDGYFFGYAHVNDPDEGKPIIIYGRINNDGDTFILSNNYKTSDGGSDQYFSMLNYLPEDVTLYVWASSSYNKNNKDKNVVSKEYPIPLYITVYPTFEVTYLTNEEYFLPNSTIDFAYKVSDDQEVSIDVYYNSFSRVHSSQKITLKNGKASGKISFRIPEDADITDEHYIIPYAVDNFGYKTPGPFYVFMVQNRPKINKVEFNPKFGLQSEDISVEILYDDVDKGKVLYGFMQIDNRKVEKPFTSFISNGTLNQIAKSGIHIESNETIGSKNIKFWISSSKDVEYRNNLVVSSPQYGATLQVTYKPSMKLSKPEKKVYKDGDKIIVVGSLNSHTDVTLLYFIDQEQLNETTKITVESDPQAFTTFVTITYNYKYGKYQFSVLAEDSNGQRTNLQSMEFEIHNPPRIRSFQIENDVIKPGDKLNVKGKVFDSDMDDEIRIFYKIDQRSDQLLLTLLSDSTEMSFAESITLPYDIELGDHTLHLHCRDKDNEKSAIVSIAFTVSKKADNNGGDSTDPSGGNSTSDNSNSSNSKKTRAKFAGLYAGIAIVVIVFIVLVIIAVLLLIRGKGNQNNESASDQDFQEKETQIISSTTTASVNPDEVATHDNPLFNSTEITHDNDPFSDEFEEQNP